MKLLKYLEIYVKKINSKIYYKIFPFVTRKVYLVVY